MNLFRSLRVISEAEGDGPIDWNAAATAACEATSPGDIELTPRERDGYRADISDAHHRVREVTALDFDLPPRVQIQNRHHWIDANVDTFDRIMRPITDQHRSFIPDVSRTINTGTMTFTLGFLARHVLGQYDPLLLAEEADHRLYFVHPNIERVAVDLDVPFRRFRRWIAFHEVAHAAEFGAAPWLPEHLETHVQSGIEAMVRGRLDMETFRELDATMTAVEGYAEMIMDRAFDDSYQDLRVKLEEKRRSRSPLGIVIRRILRLHVKQRQYERGKEFFDVIADRRGIEATAKVWDSPTKLPTWDEFDAPADWISRVDP